MKSSRFNLLAAASVFLGSISSAHALTKLNNTTALNAAGSWLENTAPVGTDVFVFDSAITGPLSVAVGASGFIGGSLQFTSIGGNVAITQSSGQTWSLSTGGVDMSTATADVTLGTSGATIRWASGNYGGMTVASGRTLTFNSNFTNQGNNKTIVMTGPGNIVFNGAAGGGVAMGFSIQGGANVTMNGSGSWGGTSSKEIINGKLNIGNDSALGGVALGLGGTSANTPTIAATGGARTISNSINLLSVATGNSTIAGSNALTINGLVTNSGGDRTLAVTNSALTTFGGGISLSEGATNRTLTINGAGNVTVASVVANGGSSTASNLTYSGAGILALSNANTFSGTLTATSGTTRIDHTNAAQNATVSIGATNTLAFGTGITAATFAGLSGSGGLTLTNSDTNAVNLSVGNNNVSTTYSGVLSGAGALSKIGTGTLILGVSGQGYGGATNVSGGTLQFSSSGNTASNLIGAGALNLSNGGVARFASTSTTTFNSSLNLGTGGGTLSYHGNQTFSPTAVTGTGLLTLQLDNGVTVTPTTFQGFSGTVNVRNGGSGSTFRQSGTADISLGNAALDLGAGISMTRNAGTNGAFTTTIGTLSGALTSSIGGSGAGGGVFTFSVGSRNENSDYAGTIQDGGTKTAFTKTGSGAQTLSGTNSYTGSTLVSDGKLVVNGSISTSILTTVSSGASLGGTGTVGAATINGILAPGNSIGTLTATGDVTWNDNDAWVFELGSAATTLTLANTTSGLSDLLNITGAGNDFLKGTGSTFTFDFVGGGTMGYYKLVDWESTTNFLAGNFVASNLAGGLTGNFIVDSGTSALYLNIVPEPNSAALLGGLGTIFLLRRRRN